MKYAMVLVCIGAALAACSPGGADSDTRTAARNSSGLGCPPEVGSGVLVNQRVNIDEALPFTEWHDDYPPLECAGELEPLIPAMPEGYALAPSVMTQPPIMGDDHVAITLGIPSDPRTTPDGIAIAPTEVVLFEIIRYAPEQIAQFRQWFEDNPGEYSEFSIEGRDILLAPPSAIFAPGQTRRVAFGITRFLGDDLVLQVSYTNMLDDQRSGALEGGETDGARLMLDILDRAEAEGLL